MKLILKENPNSSQVILYQTDDQQTHLEVRFSGETVWLTLNQMAELFQRDKSVISRHIRNVFLEGELPEERVVAKFATTAADGKTYQVEYFNLDVIISVGYRVKSLRGTQFRIWATQRLREYIVKGFTMDDERLKQVGGGGYFDPALRGAHPRYSFFGKGFLQKGSGNLRHERGLRSSRRSDETVFCHRAKQDALGGARPNRGGGGSSPG